MFKIFNGESRGTTGREKAVFLQLDVGFREILHRFKGAELSVLLAISLHMDEKGHSYPGYELLIKETGYSRPSIATALNTLCNTTIDDRVVLMRYRVRDDKIRFVGGNQYILFPTDEEINFHSSKKLTLEKPTVKKTELEEEPSLKEEPFIKDSVETSSTDGKGNSSNTGKSSDQQADTRKKTKKVTPALKPPKSYIELRAKADKREAKKATRRR